MDMNSPAQACVPHTQTAAEVSAAEHAVTAALRTFRSDTLDLDTTRADHRRACCATDLLRTLEKPNAEALHRADSLGLDDDGVDVVMNGENDV